ncbi:MAG: trypsin-like peptidase domain-containing protein [Planctomycetota bacterium]
MSICGPSFGQDNGLHRDNAVDQSNGVRSTQADHNRTTRETPVVLAVRRARPGVVNIHGQKRVRDSAARMAGAVGETVRNVNGMGTGVVIDPRGYAVTNYHVVEDVRDIRVTLDNGQTVSASLIAARVRNDLALIKIHSDQPLATIPRGRSDDLMVGESVIAIGNAYGYVHTTTMGIISALHRDVPVNETQEYRDLIQISAGINPGNSGGPLLNIHGEMIGVNVAVRVGAQQIAFAIPIDQVLEIISEMIESNNESRLQTGMRVGGGPREPVVIAQVAANSLASRSGLRRGDKVIRFGDQVINDRLDLALSMIDRPAGAALPIGVQRGGQNVQLAIASPTRSTAQKRPHSVAWQKVGIRARPLSEAALQKLNRNASTTYRGGLYVTEVRAGSAAAEARISKGDILVAMQGFETTTVDEIAVILDLPDVRDAAKAKFYLMRQEQAFYGDIRLASRRENRSVR